VAHLSAGSDRIDYVSFRDFQNAQLMDVLKIAIKKGRLLGYPEESDLAPNQ
jgi:hypothetical protein